jgi:hypothetical protein
LLANEMNPRLHTDLSAFYELIMDDYITTYFTVTLFIIVHISYLPNLAVAVTGLRNSDQYNDVHNQVQQQQQQEVVCYHQCTRCAILFSCDYIYNHQQVGLRNQCGNPFYYGKCSTCKGTNGGGTSSRTTRASY